MRLRRTIESRVQVALTSGREWPPRHQDAHAGSLGAFLTSQVATATECARAGRAPSPGKREQPRIGRARFARTRIHLFPRVAPCLVPSSRRRRRWKTRRLPRETETSRVRAKRARPISGSLLRAIARMGLNSSHPPKTPCRAVSVSSVSSVALYPAPGPRAVSSIRSSRASWRPLANCSSVGRTLQAIGAASRSSSSGRIGRTR